MNNHRCKEEAFADDFIISWKIEETRSNWESLQQVIPLYGYFPKPSKSYLVVKEQYFKNAIEIFRGNKFKITTERKKTFQSSNCK